MKRWSYPEVPGWSPCRAPFFGLESAALPKRPGGGCKRLEWKWVLRFDTVYPWPQLISNSFRPQNLTRLVFAYHRASETRPVLTSNQQRMISLDDQRVCAVGAFLKSLPSDKSKKRQNVCESVPCLHKCQKQNVCHFGHPECHVVPRSCGFDYTA
jgi:hypothetical protein